jgi:nucleotide-binding universal stress UspA family protein
MVKRILVGLAGTIYTPVAIRTALELAQQHGAELTGVTVVDVGRLAATGPVPAGGAHYAEKVREHRLQVTGAAVTQAVAEFEAACRENGVKHTVRSEVGDACTLLLSLSRYHDLTVFGVRSVFEYDFGANDPGRLLAQLLDAGLRPLVAVCQRCSSIRKVLIAYSGSTESASTLRRFVQMRLWPTASVRIVHFGTDEAVGQQLLDDAAEYSRAHGLQPEAALLATNPKDNLLPYAAEWGADLLVLGNSAKGLMRRRLFGETALNAMREADQMLFLSQ